MPQPTAHPSPEQLSAYNLGQLPPEEATSVESHISECEPCCETVINLSSDDTFVGLLKETRQLAVDDQTLAHDSQIARSSSPGDIPVELAEHPRYEIVRLIGKGGMGDVYEAVHRKMERRVALKVINRALFQKAEAVNRFHREVTTAAQLTHPNIVTSHDADQAGDFHFMVMEFVDGVDLSQIVKNEGALPVADACEYVRQAAIGLQHAHKRGMVHRDIKPHNLMVTANDTVKILDFGLASLAPEASPTSDIVATQSDLTAAGAIMGTPDFISPEQANDARQADIRSDIYSLGATLYFLLSGQVPFVEGSVMHKLKSHAQVEPESLDSVRSDVPVELVAIVSKMMAKDPDERFRVPSEVAEALKPFCELVEPQAAIASQTQVEPQTQLTPNRRSKFLSTTTVVALLAAAIFAGFYFLQTGDGGLGGQLSSPTDTSTIGGHQLTIIDTSGKKPLGGTSRTHDNEPLGVTTHSFESANGRYKITLVNEVLTVNGDQYKLENPNDSIRIVDDRVEITHVAELPKPFAYDLSQVPNDVQEIYGYRPNQIREDGRFERILAKLDQVFPNNFMTDRNLQQVLLLKWANDDRTFTQPLFVLTVTEGSAMEFATKYFGIKMEAGSDLQPTTYYPIRMEAFDPRPNDQFVRFVDRKTLVLSSRDFLDAHQIAVKKQPNTGLSKIAASISDAPAWVIANTSDKEFVEEIKASLNTSPLAAALTTQLPIWENTSHLTLSLTLGDDPTLQMSAHARAADQQPNIMRTVETLPVTLANLLRSIRGDSGFADKPMLDALIGALGEAQVTAPSNMASQLRIPLKKAEPHLLRLLNSWPAGLGNAKSNAFRAASVNNLRQIGMGMLLFEQEHGYLPSVTTKLPEAKHPVSWRVAILKYLDERLYKQYKLDEPWDSENNRKLLKETPSYYRHPSQAKGTTSTCYVTLVGNSTATGDGTATITMLDDILDAPDQTIVVAEGTVEIPWTKPEDFPVTGETTLPVAHPDREGWNVIFADGSVHFISTATSKEAIKALVNRNDGEAVKKENGVWKKRGEIKKQPLESPNVQSISPSKAEEEKADLREMLQFVFGTNPDLQKRVAKELIENGDEADAKRVLSNIRQMDPKAKASLDLAKIYENKGDFAQAADAYLDAYRRQPDLLSDDHLDTITKAKRTSEFVDVFTVDNLRKLGFVDPSAKIVRRLILNEATREDGVEFLRRVWVARPDTHFDLLKNRPDELWPLIPDPMPLVRATVLPTNFDEEAAGWERFSIDWIDDRKGGGSSRLLEIQPLMKSKRSLRRLADDVLNAIERNPQWTAGVALLGCLEAELDNEPRAIQLFEQVLTNQESPIPYQSAWAFGSVLENKSEALDQLAIKLYERSMAIRGVYQEDALRVSPLKNLATLYAKHSQREKARQLLTRLAEPPKNRWVICSPARVPSNALRCLECHQKERNLYDFTVMSDKLTEIGYPVEALMSLYRVDASFYNAYGSDKEWAKAIAPDSLPNAFDWEHAGKENFKPIKKKAEAAITPQMVLKSLQEKTLSGHENDDCLIELRVGVRGESGEPTLFSPVIDILELAAAAKGDEAAIAKVQIDQLLAEEFEQHPKNLNAGVAATLFAFTRGDLESAKARSQKLVERINATEPGQNDIALWLVARRAVDHETTRTNGEVFAKRALAAAEKSEDPIIREAVVRGQF